MDKAFPSDLNRRQLETATHAVGHMQIPAKYLTRITERTSCRVKGLTFADTASLLQLMVNNRAQLISLHAKHRRPQRNIMTNA